MVQIVKVKVFFYRNITIFNHLMVLNNEKNQWNKI